MLTQKQKELLLFIHERMQEQGVPPSFDEMKVALDLKSKSGIHRLITGLEERGFLRRRALPVSALEGKIRLKVEDAAGRVIYLEAAQGEHIFLPGGYKYTLEATGVKTVFFWTSGPSPRYGLVEIPEFSAELKALRK